MTTTTLRTDEDQRVIHQASAEIEKAQKLWNEGGKAMQLPHYIAEHLAASGFIRTEKQMKAAERG